MQAMLSLEKMITRNTEMFTLNFGGSSIRNCCRSGYPPSDTTREFNQPIDTLFGITYLDHSYGRPCLLAQMGLTLHEEYR